MKAVAKRPHTDGKGLARFDRKVEKPVAKPDYAGRTLGNMTGGRSRRASEPTNQDAPARTRNASQYGPVHGHAGPCSSARPRRRKEDPSTGPTGRPRSARKWGKARRTCVPATGLTRCMQVRFARARAKCAHRRAFKVHATCFNAHTDNGDDEKRTRRSVEALASSPAR